MTWALDPPSLALLDSRLRQLRPTLAVEAGSGESTLVFARHAERTISLEHHPVHARRTLGRLRKATPVELRRARLADLHTPGGTFPWYDTDLPDGIGFALIDGPPGEVHGRQAAAWTIFPHLIPGAEVWLDDTHRSHERACLDLWSRHWTFHVEPLDPDGTLSALTDIWPRV